MKNMNITKHFIRRPGQTWTDSILYLSVCIIVSLMFVGGAKAEIFTPLPTTGSVDVVLHPGETVSAGDQRLVSFGVPFPRNLIGNVSDLKVVDGSGNELPSAVQETMRWHSVSGDPAVGGVRAALFYINVQFDSLTPQLIRVVYGDGRNPNYPSA